MTAQERHDCRRVQASREAWKTRAVRRGEDRRRFRERRNEVDRSRQGWRDRAVAAEQRVAQLEVETHQLRSALTRVPEPSTLGNALFFKVMSISISCCTVPSRAVVANDRIGSTDAQRPRHCRKFVRNTDIGDSTGRPESAVWQENCPGDMSRSIVLGTACVDNLYVRVVRMLGEPGTTDQHVAIGILRCSHHCPLIYWFFL